MKAYSTFVKKVDEQKTFVKKEPEKIRTFVAKVPAKRKNLCNKGKSQTFVTKVEKQKLWNK